MKNLSSDDRQPVLTSSLASSLYLASILTFIIVRNNNFISLSIAMTGKSVGLSIKLFLSSKYDYFIHVR